jgi:hypothetical protein
MPVVAAMLFVTRRFTVRRVLIVAGTVPVNGMLGLGVLPVDGVLRVGVLLRMHWVTRLRRRIG